MRRFFLWTPLLLALSLAAWWYLSHTPDLPFLTSLRPLPSRVPPAFYSGGLEKGTGGQVQGNQYSTSGDLFSPSQAKTQHGGLYPIEAYPSPATCSRCHVGIHKNWAESGHAISAVNDWYLRVKEFYEFEEGGQAVRFCAGCHAPVALMTGEVGLYNRESPASVQGVSCIFCHTVESVHGGNGGYVSNPARVRMYRAKLSRTVPLKSPVGSRVQPTSIKATSRNWGDDFIRA
jgi:hypothetical protein